MKKQHKTIKILLIICLVFSAIAAFLYIQYRQMFPYGQRHICAKQMALSLMMYAHGNDGFYPAGEATPEASLSLLYKDYFQVPDILGGKTVPSGVAKEILESGRLLGPDSCSWHYVEGLTEADSCELAIFWDKVPGLGHNCERMPEGRREVVFLTGASSYIPEKEWDAFLKEQEALMAARSERVKKGEPLLSAKIQLPDGSIVDSYNGKYKIRQGSGSSSSDSLNSAQLKWYKIFEEGETTFILELPGMISDPVKVKIKDDKATPASFIFKMHNNAGS